MREVIIHIRDICSLIAIIHFYQRATNAARRTYLSLHLVGEVLPFVGVVVEQLGTPFHSVHDLNRSGQIAFVATNAGLRWAHGGRRRGCRCGCGRCGGRRPAQQLRDVDALGSLLFEQFLDRERSGGR